MAESGAEASLVNTGWNGEGKRLSCAIPAASLARSSTALPARCARRPSRCSVLRSRRAFRGVDSAVLDPRNGWSSADKWQEKAEPAQLFMDNFKQYSDTEAGARLALAGPQLQKSAVEA